MVMREQILHGFEEQRVLVDALTNVCISLLLKHLGLIYPLRFVRLTC